MTEDGIIYKYTTMSGLRSRGVQVSLEGQPWKARTTPGQDDVLLLGRLAQVLERVTLIYLA